MLNRKCQKIEIGNGTTLSLLDENKVIATCLIRNGNEFSHVYVVPAYRGGGSEVLLDMCHHALAYVMNKGYEYIWGTLYSKRLANWFVHNGAVIEETPEQRTDGKYLVKFCFGGKE